MLCYNIEHVNDDEKYDNLDEIRHQNTLLLM